MKDMIETNNYVHHEISQTDVSDEDGIVDNAILQMKWNNCQK